MKELRETYFSIQMTLFPVLEEEKTEISGKIKEFVELIEAVKPAGFLNVLLHWTGLGRPMKDREAIIRALMLKHVSSGSSLKIPFCIFFPIVPQIHPFEFLEVP